MKIIIAGASGLIGKALINAFSQDGIQCIPLHRGDPAKGADWNPALGFINAALFEGADAIINLSGESIAKGLWTEARKTKLWDSRVLSTNLIVDCLRDLKSPPKVLLNASAVGFYGDRGDEVLSEASGPGSGFLADLAKEWERSAMNAERFGMRVILARFGIVISKDGGALRAMLPAFRLGLGGKIGSGIQYMSWISLKDVVSAIKYILFTNTIRGPVNMSSPNPVSNAQFTRELGRVLGRPTFVALPAWVCKGILGEMGIEMLLASTRAVPHKLLDAGFEFECSDIHEAFRSELA